MANTQARGMGAMGGISGIAGTAGALIGGAGVAIGAYGRLPLESASAAGQAATMLVGNQLREMTQPSHQAFIAERLKGAGIARKAWEAGRMEDTMGTIAKTILIAGGVAAMAAAAPAVIAAAAGGAAIAGGTAALGAGGAAAAGGGLMSMLSNPKSLAQITLNNNAYEQLSAGDLARMTQQGMGAQEEMDPLKKLASGYLDQNWQRNLGVQRTLGLSDQQFYNQGPNRGFLQGAMAPGGGNRQFTEEQVMDMFQGIMGAGGSARMGAMPGIGLEMQKNFNLTNAPQILGTMSRTMGGASETKEATMRILTEAFKQGLNDSELSDLLRGFTQTTSEIIAKSGARTQGDVERITAQFGKGMTESTGVGLEAAKSGYEAYQKISAQTGGPFSVKQRAAMLSNPIFKRIAMKGGESAAITMEKLKQIPAGLLTEGHPAVQSALYLYNSNLGPGEEPKTAQDVIAAMKGTYAAGASMSGSFFGGKATVEAWQKANPYKTLDEAPANIQQARRMMQLSMSTSGVGATPELTTEQQLKSAGAQFEPTGPSTYAPFVSAPSAGKQADVVAANVATAQGAFIDNFEKFKDSLVPANDGLGKIIDKLILLGQVASDVASGKNTDKAALARAASTLAGSQPQASSSSALGANAFSYK